MSGLTSRTFAATVFMHVFYAVLLLIIGPHRMHGINAAKCYRCRTFRGTFVCVLDTHVLCAKTTELIVRLAQRTRQIITKSSLARPTEVTGRANVNLNLQINRLKEIFFIL